MDEAYARRTDPFTSHAAADSIAHALSGLQKLVFDALKESGQRGMTIDELVAYLGLEKVTISPRLRPLSEKRLVEACGERPGRSGRAQTIWKAIR